MTDPETLEEPNFHSSREDNLEHLTQELGSLRQWLTNFTQEIDCLPRQIDQVFEILNPISEFLYEESTLKDEFLKRFNSAQESLENQTKLYSSNLSNLHDNLQLSGELVKRIESSISEQNNSQYRYDDSIKLLIADVEAASSDFRQCQESLAQVMQSIDCIEGSINKIRLDFEASFLENISEFEKLKTDFTNLHYESNSVIQDYKIIVSGYQTKIEQNKNVRQNIIARIIDSKLTLPIMNLLVLSALSFIIIILVVHKDNNSTGRNIPKHSALKSLRNLS